MPELYKFSTPIQVWRYNDAGVTVVADAVPWEPKAISRERWDRSIEDTQIKVSVPDDTEPFRQFLLYNPSHPITLDIYNLDASKLLLTGTVMNAQFRSNDYMIDLTISGLSNVLSGDIPEHRFSPGCNYDLFDDDCGLSRVAHQVAFPKAEVTLSNNGRTMQHPALATMPDGYFTDGTIDNGAESILVLGHEGDTVHLLVPFVVLTNSTMVGVPGCDKLEPTCGNKFLTDNRVNRLGFDLIPEKNPVEGF